MPSSSWLFIKEIESIRIERSDRTTIVVAGPADMRKEHDFPDEEAVQAFQIGLCEQLTSGGWVPLGRRSDATSDDTAPRHCHADGS